MSVENLNTDEANQEQSPDDFQQMAEEAGVFDKSTAEQNVADAKESLEQEPQIPYRTEKLMPDYEMYLPITPKIDQLIEERQRKTEKELSRVKKENLDERRSIWKRRVLQFKDPSAKPFYKQLGDPDSSIDSRDKKSQRESIQADMKAQLEAMIEHKTGGRDAQRFEQNIQNDYDLLFDVSGGEINRPTAIREAVLTEVNEKYIQAKKDAIMQIIAEAPFFKRKGLEASFQDELEALDGFDVVETRESERAKKRAKQKEDAAYSKYEQATETVNEDEQANSIPEQETEEQSSEADSVSESESEAEPIPRVVANPGDAIAAVLSQKTIDALAGHTHAEKPPEEQQETTEETDTPPKMSAEAASQAVIDNLEEIAKTVDKKDVLDMIYAEDWMKYYDKIVQTLFDGNYGIDTQQTILNHMSREELSQNLDKMLENDAFYGGDILERLGGIDQREQYVFQKHGYGDAAKKHLVEKPF